MDESLKRGHSLVKYVEYPGIDIGCGPYPPAYSFLALNKRYPGYNGKILPFPDNHFKTVHASHCLEHIVDYKLALKEWFRVLDVGGHLILFVPHQYLYEKKSELPSRFNTDHKRFYTPGKLLLEIEESLNPNTYRVMHVKDGDTGFDYTLPPHVHSSGAYEIECVIKKISRPDWILA